MLLVPLSEGLLVETCEYLAPHVARVTCQSDAGSADTMNLVVKKGTRSAIRAEAIGLEAIAEASKIFKVPKVISFKDARCELTPQYLWMNQVKGSPCGGFVLKYIFWLCNHINIYFLKRFGTRICAFNYFSIDWAGSLNVCFCAIALGA